MLGLGIRVREARLRAGLTQEELSFSAGVTQHYLSHAEGGHRNITVGALRRLAAEMGVTLSKLLEGLG